MARGGSGGGVEKTRGSKRRSRTRGSQRHSARNVGILMPLSPTTTPASQKRGQKQQEEEAVRVIRREGRFAYLLAPPRGGGSAALPLLLVLHGAGRSRGGTKDLARHFRWWAAERRCLVLVPESAGATWDLIASAAGSAPGSLLSARSPDAAFLSYGGSVGERVSWSVGGRSVGRWVGGSVEPVARVDSGRVGDFLVDGRK